MTFDTRTIDLRKLSSLTKYPSIPTYHALGEKGALLEEPVARDPAAIAAWREAGGQPFVGADELAALAGELGLDPVPALFEIDAASLPRSIEDAHAFIRERLGTTRCQLDEGAGGEPEGV